MDLLLGLMLIGITDIISYAYYYLLEFFQNWALNVWIKIFLEYLIHEWSKN